MQKKHWQRIETILDTVLSLPEHERASYLTYACNDDEELLQEVKSILWGIEESEKTHYLERASADNRELIDELAQKNDTSNEDYYIGKQIGHYKIIESAGTGGMGTVYRAERSDGQFHQSVAIKLLKHGYHSSEIIHRFRIEQEILANLHHPNIAQLYDAGLTDDGTPYLIMEYVDGVPINVYANCHRLTIRERLDLFIKVCDTVQFAHTNLVIHRDLKTQNILVNTQGQIKILDFGVAKLIDPASTDITLIETQPGQLFWTPHYASPEQIRGDAVSTTSDVYSLGVLLYKLLTDTYPFDLSGKTFSEISYTVINHEPTSPSETVKKSQNIEHIAITRNLTAGELKKELKGDLDSIVLKTLRKGPKARFESARQLVEDLQRYQNNLPVLSRKGNLRYLARKFIRRNAVLVTFLLMLLITISGLVMYYTTQVTGQRNKAIMEAQKAQILTNFMINIFKNADPYDQNKKNLTAREILDRSTRRVQTSISDPDIKATMLAALGGIYEDLGMYSKAKPLFLDAMNIRENLDPGNIRDMASSYYNWADINELMGNYETSKNYFKKSGRMYLRMNDDSSYAKNILELGWVCYLTADYSEADSLVTTAMNIDRVIYGNHSKRVARSYQYLAWINSGEGDYKAADSLFRRALSQRELLYKGDHPLVAQTLAGLGRTLYNEQQYDSAEMYINKSLAMNKRLFGNVHPNIAKILDVLGLIKQRKHEYDLSQQFISKALQMDRKIYGNYAPETIETLGDLATTYFYAKQYQKAADIFIQVKDTNIKALGPDHPEVATDYNNVAMCLWKAGKKQEALVNFQKSVTLASKIYKPAHPHLIYFRKNLADLYQELGNYQMAEKIHLQNFKVLRDSLGLHDKRSQVVTRRLITFYSDWGKHKQENYYRSLLDNPQN